MKNESICYQLVGSWGTLQTSSAKVLKNWNYFILFTTGLLGNVRLHSFLRHSVRMLSSQLGFFFSRSSVKKCTFLIHVWFTTPYGAALVFLSGNLIILPKYLFGSIYNINIILFPMHNHHVRNFNDISHSGLPCSPISNLSSFPLFLMLQTGNKLRTSLFLWRRMKVLHQS